MPMTIVFGDLKYWAFGPKEEEFRRVFAFYACHLGWSIIWPVPYCMVTFA